MSFLATTTVHVVYYLSIFATCDGCTTVPIEASVVLYDGLNMNPFAIQV